MAIVSDVEIRLRADIARLQADMDAARRSVGGAMNGITSAVRAASAAMAAFVGAAVIGAVIKFASGLKEMVTGAIDAAGSLNDLSIQTGASVAALMEFKAIGATSDTTVETLAGAMNKLAKGMASATEESKGIPGALKSIGLNFEQIRKLAPEQQMIQVAKALDGFGDGAGKSAAAMALYGKEGAKLLPFLADLASESDRVSAALTDQEIAAKKALAAMADNYGDNLTKIQLASAETRKAISLGMLPALYEASQAFLTVTSASGGLKDTIKKLSDDGSIADWTRKGITALSYFLDALQVTARLVDNLFRIIAGSLTTVGTVFSGFGEAMVLFIRGEYQKSWDTMKNTATASKGVIVDAVSDIGASMSAQTFGSKIREQMALVKDLKTEAAEAKKQVDFSAEDPKVAARIAKEASAYAALIASIKTKIDENKRELETNQAATESQKIQIKLDQELASGKLKLSDAHIANAKAAIADLAAIEALVKAQTAQREVTKYIAESTAARTAESEALDAEYAAYGKSADARESMMVAVKAQTETQKKLAALEEVHLPVSDQIIAQLNAEEKARVLVGQAILGQTKALRYAAQLSDENKKFAAESIYDEKTRNAALLAIDADVWKERIALAGAGTEAQKSLQTEYDTWYANQLMKPQLAKQKEFWDTIDKTAHDTFVSITAGGKDAFTRLKDTAKNVFFDWLYQMTLKKWVLNIGTAIDGPSAVSAIAGATGATNGAGGLGALASAGSSLSSLYSVMTGGGLGTGFLGSLAGGLNGAGMGSGLTSSLGLSIGNSVASVLGPAVSGALSTGLGALAAALPWVAAGAAVLAIGKKAFGMGDKNVNGTTLNGSLSGSSFAGSMDSAWTQKGGWFRSDKSGVDKAAVDATVAASLGTAYQAITSASADYAKVLGLNADSIMTRTQSISIALGKDQAANQKAIEDFFVGVGDNIARELLPNIAMFQQEGEAAAATLQRLASNFQTVGAALAVMGTTTAQAFGATGTAAVTASERLVALAGGVQALAAQAQYFADNFLSQAEKVAPAQKQITEVLSALGYGYVKTVDQYKQAVLDLARSGALATDAGAATYSALMALAPAFKTVTDYANELKQAANDSAGAALDALSRAVDAQKDVVTAAYTRAMDVLDARISGLNDTISTTAELSKALRDGIVSSNTPAAGMASRQVAMAQVGAALAIAKASGLLPSADSLSDALAAIKSTSADQFATLADYQRSVAQSNAAIEQLGGLTDGQLSVAEQQLAAAIAQKDALTAANEAQLARLDALVVATQAQVAAVNGTNSTLLTIGQALVGVYNATQVLSGYTGISATTVAPSTAPSATIDTGALLVEMQTLNARIASMEAHAAQTANSTGQFAAQFNNVSAGGNTLLVETA